MDTVAIAITSSASMSAGIQNIAVETELIQVLTVEQFIEKCLRFNEAHPETAMPDIKVATDCPVHIYAEEIGQKACKSVVGGYKECPLCHRMMCPVCHSHAITVVSRITGYVSTVADRYGSGWNAAKAEEFKQRKREKIR